MCPDLQKLHLKDLGPESGGQDEAGVEVPGPIFVLQQNKKLFTNLGKIKLNFPLRKEIRLAH